MRLFLGINIPQTERESLYKQIIPLIRKYPQFKWIHPDLYHSSVQFFGEVEDVKKLTESIKTTLYDKEKFYLYGLELGLFQAHDLVLHMKYRREKKIDDIVDSLEKTYPTFVKQRAFIFHTAIGHAPYSSKQQYFLLQKLLDRTPVEISYQVESLALMASVKNSEGRKYHVLEEFPLI